MESEPVRLTKRWFREVWEEGNAKTIDELAPAMKLHGLQSDPLDAAAFKEFHRKFLAAFSEIRVELKECFGDDERSAFVMVFHARHTGDGLGIPATSRRVSVLGIGTARFQNGKVVEAYNQFDEAGMMRQLGQ